MALDGRGLYEPVQTDLTALMNGLTNSRQVPVGASDFSTANIVVNTTTGGDAVACTVSQACQYAIVEAPSGWSTIPVNTSEVKVSVVTSGTLSHANCGLQGRSLQLSNYEGIKIPCTNTNQLRFASTANANVKVWAVVTA